MIFFAVFVNSMDSSGYMDEALRQKLLDKKLIGQKLREFRERHGFKNQKAFQNKAGLTGLFRNEDGSQFPSWETLVKVASTCGRNVSDFIYDLEPHATAQYKPPRNKHELELHNRLQEILEDGDPDAAKWIAGNITVFHRDQVTRPRRRDR